VDGRGMLRFVLQEQPEVRVSECMEWGLGMQLLWHIHFYADPT